MAFVVWTVWTRQCGYLVSLNGIEQSATFSAQKDEAALFDCITAARKAELWVRQLLDGDKWSEVRPFRVSITEK